MKKSNTKYTILYVIMAIIIIILLVWKILPLTKSNTNTNKLSFIIKSNNIDVKIGNQVKIDYILSNEISIDWKSDNNDVVTISNGIITGVGLGDTLIHGTVKSDNETITRSAYVSTYYGDKNAILSEIVVPDGELFITKGSSYQINTNYSPLDSYITSIDYETTNSNVALFNDGVVYAKNVGRSDITVTVNNAISKTITVNVIESNIEPIFSNRVKDIDVDTKEIKLKPGETKEIKYEVMPSESFVESIEWESSNESVVTVSDGILTAKSSGEAVITLTINKSITKEIKVSISVPVSGIGLKSKDKIVLKVGKSEAIKTSIMPANATNKKVYYTSSNNSVQIDENGKVVGISKGEGTITVRTDDGNFKAHVSYVVNPQTGVVNGDGGVWGYSSSSDQIPVKADLDFFQKLASNGKGILSGNIYTYTDNERSYKYDISKSLMSSEGTEYLMRIYYPQNVDLSEVNTFTFFGGSGERKMNGYFNHLDQNRNELTSSGIIILVTSVSVNGGYNANYGVTSTEFIQSIVNQKAGVKNAVGGYSMSGDACGKAAESGIYDRLIIFETGFSNYNSASNVFKNIEITFYKPNGPDMISPAVSCLNGMYRNKFSDVTVVSNNTSDIVGKSNYISSFLIINPGSNLGRGHTYTNISNAKVFSYACR